MYLSHGNVTALEYYCVITYFQIIFYNHLSIYNPDVTQWRINRGGGVVVSSSA